MSKLKLEKLKNNFIQTLNEAAALENVCPSEVTRDVYNRVAVDNNIENRLSKRDLELLGGFTEAKKRYIKTPKKKLQQPKVLIFDIETAPVIAHVWGLWENNVSLNQIVEDWHVLSWAAKWLDSSEEEIMYMDQRDAEDVTDDRIILEGIWYLLDEADIVVTQNGKRFDQKKLNARFVLNGMQPPSSYKHIDTKIIASKHFGFTSNKLEYMTDKLCKKYKKKVGTRQFVGHSMWMATMAGNEEAWNEMEIYNKYDVLSLEELYKILIPWDGTVDFNLYHEQDDYVCRCGSTSFRESGFHYTSSGKFQKYACVSCGEETRSRTNLLSKEKKQSLRLRVAK